MLKAYNIIGCIPYEVLDSPVEFSSVDYTAKALLTLSETPKGCLVFHPYNNHTVFFRDVINALTDADIHIRRCEMDEWNTIYSEALKDQNKARYLLSLFAYKSRESNQRIENISTANTFTIQALDRLGFAWPIVTDAYLFRFVDAMKGLGFYEY
jgi:hypothetical protein